ncbi:hypothetical protein F2P56_031568 [Juglans regia]|uniref:Stress-response A/B barrel domain-containing protein HS1-like n=2 Tax=Juglans regia TaxID=51240 RepID=A0A2I4DVV5_JUGRE|nr:stress-response A/B barrel domain-containing protein HS1-like [Juglans regia]KAF5445893.1 hypothetical protein F2P56_031568 [Juglans regia]
MEEARGSVVKHVFVAKFKDETSAAQIDQLIRDMANLVNLIEPMKSLHWGMDVSAGKKNQGFTHVFECTFESMEGIAEYVAHPAHKEYAKSLMPNVEKFQVFDYKLTKAII